MRPASTLKYRPDIDGLRAVAVLPVVAFHAKIPPFSGGFVGVDVFFTISGYLIGSILLEQIQARKFSIATFYERRIRRLFPALVTMLAVTFILGFTLSMPGEFVAFAKSLCATLVSVSNFYFWRTSGYFASGADQQPLLHTWSLSVEEQFYVFFPLFLTVACHLSKNRLATLILLLAVGSFTFSSIQTLINPGAAFYLPVSRAWEILLGVLVALPLAPAITNHLVNNIVGAAGVVMIAAAVFNFDQAVPFPGLAALLPCGGAALVIYTGTGRNTWVFNALAWRPIVFVGLISYSLYVWHWPVMFFQDNFSVFGEWLSGRTNKLIELVVSLALAVLSWRFIERPFRSSASIKSDHKVFYAAGATVGSFFLVALAVVGFGGFPTRFSPATARAAAFIQYDPSPAFRTGECFVTSDVGDDPSYSALKIGSCMHIETGKRNYLLFGDSYAADLWYGMSRKLGGVNVLQATGAGCRPLLRMAEEDGAVNSRCRTLLNYVFFQFLRENKLNDVILAGAWATADLGDLATTLDWASARGIRVTLIGPKITYDMPLPRLLAAAIQRGDLRLPDRHRPARAEILDAQMAKIAKAKNVRYFSFFAHFCHDGHCEYVDQLGHPFVFDKGHFTSWGSLAFADQFQTVLSN